MKKLLITFLVMSSSFNSMAMQPEDNEKPKAKETKKEIKGEERGFFDKLLITSANFVEENNLPGQKMVQRNVGKQVEGPTGFNLRFKATGNQAKKRDFREKTALEIVQRTSMNKKRAASYLLENAKKSFKLASTQFKSIEKQDPSIQQSPRVREEMTIHRQTCYISLKNSIKFYREDIRAENYDASSEYLNEKARAEFEPSAKELKKMNIYLETCKLISTPFDVDTFFKETFDELASKNL